MGVVRPSHCCSLSMTGSARGQVECKCLVRSNANGWLNGMQFTNMLIELAWIHARFMDGVMQDPPCPSHVLSRIGALMGVLALPWSRCLVITTP